MKNRCCITRNPHSTEPLAEWGYDHAEGLRQKIDRCQHAWESWRATAVSERSAYLAACARVLRAQAPALAHTITQEMGKPLAQSLAEVEKCAWVCEYYAEHGPAFLAAEDVETEARTVKLFCEPLGLLLAIMPWNFPFWQFFRFAAAALVAGNAIVLKHALNTTGCGRSILSVLEQAGLPADLVTQVVVPDQDVEALIRAPEIRAVTLTGSTRAGRAVASLAGSCLKKCVLELGGSDPYLVLEDADLALAAKACADSRLINSGQSCIAAKRIIVHGAVRPEFEERLLAILADHVVGDPMSPETRVGPLAREDLRGQLHRQVSETLALGANAVLGAALPASNGYHYPVSLLTGVRPGMPAFDEELFGPVAALIEAQDEAEAIQLANQSVYGLGAAVFTRDLDRGMRIAASKLQAGTCVVNDFVKSDPRLPFGGILDSGYGRELGRAGIHEFVNLKTVVIA